MTDWILYDRVRVEIDYRRFNGRGYVSSEIEFTGQDDPLLVMLLERRRQQAERRLASEGPADPTMLG